MAKRKTGNENLSTSKTKASSSGGSAKIVSDKPMVVAIGASAGGIEATTELLTQLPNGTGLSFVLVQHLDPKHQSFLADLLSKRTAIKVSEVQDGIAIEPDHAYVIPPNTSMSVSKGRLRLHAREESRGVHMPIDKFMRSVAEEYGDNAIGIVLSGSGTDGTLGIAEIQAHGGVTFAQDDATAKYNSMPRSAVNSGSVDYILGPKQIARELVRIARLSRTRSPIAEEAEVPAPEGAALSTIFQMLRRNTGVDFTHYRQTTILRRIQRRMIVHKMEKLEEYVRYLRANSSETKALYQDMLINVTSFFRNPQMFDALI